MMIMWCFPVVSRWSVLRTRFLVIVGFNSTGVNIEHEDYKHRENQIPSLCRSTLVVMLELVVNWR